MKRLLAFVVAAAMVAGSLYVRSRLDDDGADSAADRPGAPRVVCSTELAAACKALGSDAVEDAGTTADRLVGTDHPDVDVWIVPSPWPELVDIRRSQAQREPFFERSETVATSRLAIVAWNSPPVGCGNPPPWKCIGDAAAKGLKVGFANPVRDGIGLLVLGHAVASYFGRPNLSTLDLEDPAFEGWFNALEQSDVVASDDPLSQMLITGHAKFDAVAISDAAATATLATAARKDDVELFYPAPMATAGAVVAARRGKKVDVAVRDRVASSLRSARWTPGGRSAGLPDAGFLDALVERWKEATE